MRRNSRLATVVVMVGLVVVGSCSRQESVEQTIFSVEGMTCDSCSNGIIATLEKVEGVISVAADHEKGSAEAVYQSTTVGADELAAEIEKLGFTVIGLKTEAVVG